MKTAYIFHDSFCDPFSEWYPWMKETLESKGYLVIVPKFPSPAGQSYESWKVVIKNYFTTFDSDTIIIGHGTGGTFGLRIVQELPQKIRGLFLVASYGEPIGNIGYDRLNTTFYEPSLDWNLITSHVTIIRIFAGDQDPFVPMAITEHLAEHLGESVEVIPEGGHLGKAAGFTQIIPVASRIFESLSEIDRSIEIEPTSEPLPIPLPRPDTIHQDAEPTPSPEPIHNPELKAHTMYQDMSQLVNSNQGRVASSLLTKAHNDEARAKAASPASGKNIMYTLFSVFTIAAVLGIGGYLFQKYAPAPAIMPTPEIVSLIRAESHTKIEITDEPIFLFVQKIKKVLSEPITDSTLGDMYYTTKTGRASFNELITALGVTTIPLGLAEEFQKSNGNIPVFMHGMSQKNQQTSHFLVLRFSNYDITFSLMKQWERSLLKDIGVLMNIPPEFLKTRSNQDVFKDEVIQNKNVRVLRYHKPTTAITFEDSVSGTSPVNSITSTVQAIIESNPFASTSTRYDENEIMLAYFFLNEKTLIITDNLEIIPEIITRYANRQIYQ